MSTTPGKGRTSGIPTPGRTSHIPTPGRPRSSSSVHQPSADNDDEYISRAFADAIRSNDPANHRTSHADGRPPSSASTSSAMSASVRSATGAKIPFPRPSSRASDTFTRSSSRAGRSFDIGDNVRIESLGFEGTLRYLGEIDGKPGQFAGVELSGGFAGKGKNDGSVNGKKYFVCPPRCGVFIAANKLSWPTVGPSVSRPSSVASHRNGRVTPSFNSGRVTPSLASSTTAQGRKTPSHSLNNGRVTPAQSGRVTPSASTGRRTPAMALPTPRQRTITATRIAPQKAVATPSTITPGSRASKYVGMTAKQLNNRTTGAASPTRSTVFTSPPSKRMASPIQNRASPPRPPSSPFTPKAGRTAASGVLSPTGTPTRPRTTLTPRQRVPSSVSMPPPPSPSTNARSVSLNDPKAGTSIDISANQRAIQDMIDKVSRPSSSASVMSSQVEMQYQLQFERLQSRLDASEDENRRLRADLATMESTLKSSSGKADVLSSERDQLNTRISELESSLRTTERSLSERDSKIESLERIIQESTADIDKAKSEAEARIRDIQSKLDDKEALAAQLKELIDAKEGLQSENDAVLAAKNAEIGVLEARVQKAYAELEEERRELGGQVEELRKAGQETIALYEERLSAADSRRYEMEDLIASLEDQLRAKERPVSPSTVARQATSAIEIECEMLRENNAHLEKKVSSLENTLEELRHTLELEGTAARERLARHKEREDGVRNELTETQKEVERITKSEEGARARIEEIEEALRESTVALENARAEVEILRTEIADLEGNAASAGLSLKSPTRATATGDFELLRAEKTELERICKEREAELAAERESSESLRQALDDRVAELEALRKKMNRDVPVNGSVTSSPSKHDLASAREEIKGLKHIVQELQMETAKASQRNKVLESENKLLLSEMDQLREEMKILEENVEQTLLREEQALEAEEAALAEGAPDGEALQKAMREMRAKYEADLEQARKRQSEAEMKAARTIHDLNKEIGELENLIESKIYREDELEGEVERLKEKLNRTQKKNSKGPSEDTRLSNGSASSWSSKASDSASLSDSASRSGEDVCEICERPGHDIFTCDLLKNDRPLSGSSSTGFIRTKNLDEVFCEDCDEPGHTSANCPHSLDVF